MRTLSCIAALLSVLIAQTPADRSFVFRNITVVDVEAGTTRPGMSVYVSNGRIVRVDNLVTAQSAGATIVDGTGMFLMPGLWDSHVHLTKLGAASLLVFLANGVTSVRDMGSDLTEVLAWRRAIDSGSRPGPRIKTPGQILESRANVDRMKREHTVEPVDRIRIGVGSPEVARAAVARLADAGADFIKVRTVADTATFHAIVAAAAEHHVKLTGHPVAPPDEIIAARMASVEHLLAFPPLQLSTPERKALFTRMRDAGVRMGTTTVNLENSVFLSYDAAVARLRSDPLKRYLSRYLASDWAEQVEEKKGEEAARAIETFVKAAPALFRDLHDMHAAGVEFLAGTDAAVAFIYPGFSLHGELESLVRNVGLTPADALRAAIINPARFFGLEHELGSIRAGFRADLVLLEANPLEDIRRTTRIAGVMRDGHWYDRRALDGLLNEAARQTSNER
jgi:imidazolonepropionase-like amidohydrolase